MVSVSPRRAAANCRAKFPSAILASRPGPTRLKGRTATISNGSPAGRPRARRISSCLLRPYGVSGTHAASSVTGSLAAPLNPSSAAEPTANDDAMRDLVAVSIVGEGAAIILATPGLPRDGRTWRFRSFDTTDLPQPIRSVTLSESGTKLFIQAGDGPGGVLDLTRQYRHQAPLQYVSASDLAIDGRTPRDSHRLPTQRFVSVWHGRAFVDDTRACCRSSDMTAIRGSIAADGVALFVAQTER